MEEGTEGSPKRILIVDDDTDLLAVLKVTLTSGGYEVMEAQTAQEAMEAVETWRPDLVTLDMNMPDSNGLETLKELQSLNPSLAVIFLTSESKSEYVVTSLDNGAYDYMCKPFDPSELLARVRAQLRIKGLTDDLQVVNKKLKSLVEIDDLTGLFNMRNIYTKLDREVKRVTRYPSYVAVIMMDIDHFKRVNDQHDHLFGSFALKEIGEIIRKSIRGTDIGARYGGDEFLIILTDTPKEGVMNFCNRLRTNIESHDFDNGESSMKLTTSIGFAVFQPKIQPSKKKIDARSLVKWADRALYDSKKKGRNVVSCYDVNDKLISEYENLGAESLEKAS